MILKHSSGIYSCRFCPFNRFPASVSADFHSNVLVPRIFCCMKSEHAIHQNKDQTLYFQKKKIYSSFKHCFFNQHLNVVGFIKKKKNLSKKKKKKNALSSNTTSGSYSVIFSKQRCSRWFPSRSQSLRMPLPFSGLTFHSVTVLIYMRLVLTIALFLKCLHMRSLVSASSWSVVLIGTFF